MKGQFFVISVVIIIAVLVLIAQYFADYRKVDPTRFAEFRDGEYASMVKDALINATKNSVSYADNTCSKLENDLDYEEEFLKGRLAKLGYGSVITHSINPGSPCYVLFEVNITSKKFVSSTKFKAGFEPAILPTTFPLDAWGGVSGWKPCTTVYGGVAAVRQSCQYAGYSDVDSSGCYYYFVPSPGQRYQWTPSPISPYFSQGSPTGFGDAVNQVKCVA